MEKIYIITYYFTLKFLDETDTVKGHLFITCYN